MIILPASKSSHWPWEPVQLPLTLCLKAENDWLSTVKPELLLAVIPCSLRGVIKNNLAAEYGEVLSYWMDRHRCGHASMVRLMVEVDEAYDLAIDLFKDLAGQLSRYRDVDSLITELVSYDPVDNSVLVRISDG